MRRAFSPPFSLDWGSPFRKRRRKRIPQHTRSVRLQLEQLEDRITPTGPTITTLGSFNGTNGSEPKAGVIVDTSGNLFGTTTAGGGQSLGSVFELARGNSIIKPLASFNLNSGFDPYGALVMDSSGNLYGTTAAGGSSSKGTIFELGHDSSTITTLASFDGTNGWAPEAGLLIDSSGNLYGTTTAGGAAGYGTIFELAHNSSTITPLASFNGTNDEYPSGLVMDGNGNLYGTTKLGGASDNGTIFELAHGSSTITTLASFDITNGESPSGPVMDSSGNLYGTTYLGGSSAEGTVFELPSHSTTITTLASFNGTDSGLPEAGVIMDSVGDLFGTAQSTNSYVVFELARGSSTITTLASFNGTNDDYPSGLVMDSNDDIYGTTALGGTSDAGTIFELQALAPGPHLAFVQQPSNTVAGTTMSSVTVAIEDPFDNIETSDNSDKITLAIGTGSPTGALNGATTLTVSGGEATFDDLSINQAGTGYTLAASTIASGVLSGTSNNFNITPAATDHLAFLQPPTSTAVGAAIRPRVTVALEDQYNNIETGDNTDEISLALSPSGILNGTTTQTVSGGEVSFSDLSINRVASGYALTASTTANGIGPLTSSNFNISPADVTTTAVNAASNYSTNTQTVTLNASVANASAPSNPVNEGTVTFTVNNGQTVIGTPVQGMVTGGKASAGFSLPAGLAPGSYTLAVSYSDKQGNYIDGGDTNATLAVNLVPTVTTNPSDQTVTAGQTVTFTAAADAYPTATIQWQVSTDSGKTFSNISGATSAALTLTNVQASQDGDEYQAVFTNSLGTATTSAATLTVRYAPTVTANPSNQAGTAGQTVTFTAAADANPIATVQWQVSTDGGLTFTDISGATSAALTLNAVTAAMNDDEYKAAFTNSVGTTFTSTATLTVQYAPVLMTGPSSQTVTAGQNATFTAAANGNPTATVQWQVSTDGGATFTNISGATSTTLTLSSVQASQNSDEYQAVFTNSFGTATTSAATLAVQYAPAVTTNPSDQTVTAGQTVTFTAAVDANPTAIVQWQVSTDSGKTFRNISGATNSALTLTNVQPSQNGDEYQAVFTNSIGTTTTASAKLTVQFTPTITTNPSNQTITADGTATFTAAANGNPTPTVQWQVSTGSGTTWTDISGATSTTLTLNNVSFFLNGSEYRAVFANSVGAGTSTTAMLIVQTTPAITSSNNTTFTVGQSGSYIVTATGSPTPTLTESETLPSGVAFTDNGNGTATLAGTPAAGTQGTYQFTITAHNGVGNSATQSFTLTLYPPPMLPPPPPSPPPAAPNVPPLLALFNELLGGIDTVNANGTTITDNLFGLPLVETYDYLGNLVSVTLLGFNITFLFG
jgi:uncharacterized repeat protein (TIGR03803 family)